jgi:hypothetical protein
MAIPYRTLCCLLLSLAPVLACGCTAGKADGIPNPALEVPEVPPGERSANRSEKLP